MAISAVNPNRTPGRFLNAKSTYALVTEPVKTAYVPYTRDEKNYIILYVCMYVCMYYTPRSYFLSTPFLYILIKFFIIFLVKLYHITNKMSSICQFRLTQKHTPHGRQNFACRGFFKVPQTLIFQGYTCFCYSRQSPCFRPNIRSYRPLPKVFRDSP